MEIPSLSDFQRLEYELSEVKTILQLFATKASLPQVIKVADIARIENVSVSQLWKNERYLLPRFGQSAFPEGSARWSLEEYLEWRHQDPKARHRAWMSHLDAERKRSIKVR
jgi:hypothetical protein